MGFWSRLFHRGGNHNARGPVTVPQAPPGKTIEPEKGNNIASRVISLNSIPDNDPPDSATGFVSPRILYSKSAATKFMKSISEEPFTFSENTNTSPESHNVFRDIRASESGESELGLSDAYSKFHGKTTLSDWKYVLHSALRTAKLYGATMPEIREEVRILDQEEEARRVKVQADIDTGATPDQLYTKGKECARNEEHKDAIAYYQAALEREKMPQYYCKIALSYFFLKDMNSAKDFCNKSLEAQKGYDKAYHILSSIYRFYSRAEDDLELAGAYHKLAEKCLKLSKKYGDSKNSSTYWIEKTLIALEKNQMNTAIKCFKEAKKVLKKHHTETSLPNMDTPLKEEDENSPLILFIEGKIANHKTKVLSSKKHSGKHITEEEKAGVNEALEKLKLFPREDQLRELTSELAKLKSNLVQLEEHSRNFVTHEEVSIAVKENPQRELEADQMEKINANLLLKEYYEAFVLTIHTAYASALVISKGDTKTDTDSVAMTVTESLLSLIPVWGSTISTIVADVGAFLGDREIKNAGAYLVKMAYNAENLNEKMLPGARAMTLNESKQQQILSSSDKSVTEGFVSKILSKIEDTHKNIINKSYVEKYNTDAKRLGHEDACKVIEQWIKYHKSHTHSPAMSDNDITTFILKAVIEHVPDNVINVSHADIYTEKNGADIGNDDESLLLGSVELAYLVTETVV